MLCIVDTVMNEDGTEIDNYNLYLPEFFVS